MPIVGVRYDERLIHGQVATFWTNALKADRIVVLDEGAANNEMVKSTLRMAVPQGVNSSIITKEKFTKNYLGGKYGEQRLFIVFRDLDIVKFLLDAGVEIKELNLGNRSDKGGDTRIARHFCIGEKEAKAVYTLIDRGVHVYSKLVPQDPSHEAIDLMKAAGVDLLVQN